MVHFPSSFVYLNGKNTHGDVFSLTYVDGSPTSCPGFRWAPRRPSAGFGHCWKAQPDVDSWCVPRVTETWENQVMFFQLPRKQNRIIIIPFFFGGKKRWSSQTPKKWSFPRTPHTCWILLVYMQMFHMRFQNPVGGKGIPIYPRLSACSTLLQFCSSTCNLP